MQFSKRTPRQLRRHISFHLNFFILLTTAVFVDWITFHSTHNTLVFLAMQCEPTRRRGYHYFLLAKFMHEFYHVVYLLSYCAPTYWVLHHVELQVRLPFLFCRCFPTSMHAQKIHLWHENDEKTGLFRFAVYFHNCGESETWSFERYFFALLFSALYPNPTIVCIP